MKRLQLLVVILASTAWGSVIVTPTPTIDTACSVDGLPVNCGAWGPYGPAYVHTNVGMQLIGLGTPSLNIALSASAEGGTFGAPPSTGPFVSALATISLNFLGSTDGPQRDGLASYSISTDGDRGQGGGWWAESAVAGLGSCSNHCLANGTLVPFELGTTFAIDMFARGSMSGKVYPTGGFGSAGLRLQLFEQDGTPVAIYDPPTAIPEPGTLLGAAVVLLLVAVARLRKLKGGMKP